MANMKIAITNKLRLDIIERRKNIGMSSYTLSEKIGNGHSKFWLQNIECGKTKKIMKDDLIKIYMTLNNTDDPDEVIYDIEQVLNQNISEKERQWYELIDISTDFSEIYDEESLMDTLDSLLDDQIIPEIRNTIFGMSTNQKQAALTTLQHLYYSLYKNSDLAYALIGIPVYGIKDLDESEHTKALNDLLSLYSKFYDLSIKNQSMDTIREWQKNDIYFAELSKEWIHNALDSFKDIISKLSNAIHEDNPDIYTLMRNFTTDVSFMIERGQPNVLKHYLKSWQMYTGKDFATHIQDCAKWFMGFQHEYDLPFILNEVDPKQLNQIYEYLNNYGAINPTY